MKVEFVLLIFIIKDINSILQGTILHTGVYVYNSEVSTKV